MRCGIAVKNCVHDSGAQDPPGECKHRRLDHDRHDDRNGVETERAEGALSTERRLTAVNIVASAPNTDPSAIAPTMISFLPGTSVRPLTTADDPHLGAQRERRGDDAAAYDVDRSAGPRFGTVSVV